MEIGFYIGYAELIQEEGRTRRFNTAILVRPDGSIAGKYRKIHLPGHAEHKPEAAFQHLEKKYFEVGNLGFRVWRFMDTITGMLICNDRRWPEATPSQVKLSPGRHRITVEKQDARVTQNIEIRDGDIRHMFIPLTQP